MSKAHLTAISRTKISAPMKWMESQGFWDGIPPHLRLDYGCGKGFDADALDFEKYDPFWFKCDDFTENQFDVITCNFVLNVIQEESERKFVLDNIKHWLAPLMTAYISIRNDKKALKGITKRGTYQGYHPPMLPLLHRGSGYEIYTLTK